MRWNWIVLIVVGSIVIMVAAGYIGRAAIRRGRKAPFVVRLINKASDQVIDIIKRPVTLAVLDEVGDVLMAGNYTKNISDALRENEPELRAMIAEKVKQDPAAKTIKLVPFHDRIIDETSQATLRIVLAVLADPRTHELITDVLRDNIAQLRKAVRDQDV
jgi:hypothetical protein